MLTGRSVVFVIKIKLQVADRNQSFADTRGYNWCVYRVKGSSHIDSRMMTMRDEVALWTLRCVFVCVCVCSTCSRSLSCRHPLKSHQGNRISGRATQRERERERERERARARKAPHHRVAWRNPFKRILLRNTRGALVACSNCDSSSVRHYTGYSRVLSAHAYQKKKQRWSFDKNVVRLFDNCLNLVYTEDKVNGFITQVSAISTEKFCHSFSFEWHASNFFGPIRVLCSFSTTLPLLSLLRRCNLNINDSQFDGVKNIKAERNRQRSVCGRYLISSYHHPSEAASRWVINWMGDYRSMVCTSKRCAEMVLLQRL